MGNKSFARVTLSPQGLSRIYGNPDNTSKYMDYKDSVIQVASLAEKINPAPEAVATFDSVPEFRGLDYVGYIIEKERYDPDNDIWVPVNKLKIIGRLANKFIDTRVAYGYTYRYRTRSVLKFTYNKPEATPENPMYVSEYYTSEPTKEWEYVTIKENEPPPTVQTFRVIPSSPTKSIFLYWLPPSGIQRDISYINIYKRPGIPGVGAPWTKIAEGVKPGVNMYEDKDVIFYRYYIYALTCVDIHGIESLMSTQVRVSLNERFDSEKKERPSVFISGPGTTPSEINLQIKKFKNQKPKPMKAMSSMKLKVSPYFGETQKDYIIKVRSLDTGEVKEIKVVLKNLIQQPDKI